MAFGFGSSIGSYVGAAFIYRTVTGKNFSAMDVRRYLYSTIKKYVSRLTFQMTLMIDEYDGLAMNELFEAAWLVFSNRISPSLNRLRVSKPAKQDKIEVFREMHTEIVDRFNGVKLTWNYMLRNLNSGMIVNREDTGKSVVNKMRFFKLSFHKKHKDMVMNAYLPHLLELGKYLKHQKKTTLKLFTSKKNYCYDEDKRRLWHSMNLDHPAKFETLAMEPEIKEMIKNDLDQFVKSRDFYRKVGKAWKRGYLLYGPPGTGKSSLVAAMANYLKFNIYDLELTSVKSNTELRKLLVATENRSILLVEDIDCSIQFQDRLITGMKNGKKEEESPMVTLSGMLNFIDGLWSSCGDERIIVFTTNHKDMIDPALLRPGRMDVHVLMSYCTPCVFRQLAFNYLGLTDHLLFGEIDELVKTTEVSPAEIAEQLMRCREVPEVMLSNAIEFLKDKKKQNEQLKVNEAWMEKEKDENFVLEEIKDLVKRVKVTTDEMADQLLKGGHDPAIALMGLMEHLKGKKRQAEHLGPAGRTKRIKLDDANRNRY